MERLGIGDDEFWSDPWRTRKVLQRKMMAQKAESFVVDAPEKVTLDSHGTIPVAIVHVSKVGVESHFQRTAVLAAMNLYTGEVSAELAFDAPAPMPPGGGAGGAEDAMLGSGHIVELTRRLGLPLSRGDYLVTLIVLDKMTEPRRMRVVESSAYEDPAVDEFLRTQLAARLGRPQAFPAPGSDPRSILPVYEAMDESPPLPKEPGIELAIERVNLLPATNVVVFGSYRLPVEKRHLTPKDSPAGSPTAIIPITLLFTGSVDARPRLAKLQIPCKSALETVGGKKIATGHFAVDIAKLVRIGMTPQTYFVYAFSGEIVRGPVPAAFVHIPLMPQRAEGSR